MKACIGCKHADWKRTAKGSLHPSGDGRCRFPYTPAPLPASMSWSWGGYSIGGGWINRREKSDKVCPTREATT